MEITINPVTRIKQAEIQFEELTTSVNSSEKIICYYNRCPTPQMPRVEAAVFQSSTDSNDSRIFPIKCDYALCEVEGNAAYYGQYLKGEEPNSALVPHIFRRIVHEF